MDAKFASTDQLLRRQKLVASPGAGLTKHFTNSSQKGLLYMLQVHCLLQVEFTSELTSAICNDFTS
jgi:hypothetical protein